jgi:hypothetical protein
MLLLCFFHFLNPVLQDEGYALSLYQYQLYYFLLILMPFHPKKWNQIKKIYSNEI